jgi:hypothetical protein
MRCIHTVNLEAWDEFMNDEWMVICFDEGKLSGFMNACMMNGAWCMMNGWTNEYTNKDIYNIIKRIQVHK